jgi:hypothetical protein
VEITFSLPNVFNVGADRRENAESLEALLECLVKQNIVYLRSMKRRGYTVPALYSSGVVYARTIWWENIPALYNRGFGDCKSLSAALVAQYRFVEKVNARCVFRFNPLPTSTDYHILVEVGPNQFEDPSRVLGMGKDENAYFRV